MLWGGSNPLNPPPPPLDPPLSSVQKLNYAKYFAMQEVLVQRSIRANICNANFELTKISQSMVCIIQPVIFFSLFF